jgi:hypothetical protein
MLFIPPVMIDTIKIVAVARQRVDPTSLPARTLIGTASSETLTWSIDGTFKINQSCPGVNFNYGP